MIIFIAFIGCASPDNDEAVKQNTFAISALANYLGALQDEGILPKEINTPVPTPTPILRKGI